MQDHRQIKALCQLKLRIQHRLLTFKLRIITIQIQTNFANRHHLLRTGCEQLLKALMQLAMLFNDDRMQPQRGIERRIIPASLITRAKYCEPIAGTIICSTPTALARVILFDSSSWKGENRSDSEYR
jgi:hypothetical protein